MILSETSPCTNPKKERRRLIFWAVLGFGAVFIWMMVYFYAYFPGSFDWDNLDQWWQIQNHQYDTWHPVFHTLIIALFSKIVNHYGFAVFMQLLLYSLVCGYLVYTMAKWRFPVWALVLTEFFLAANPQTHRILLFMWKDSALTVFMVLFTVYLVNIWKTNGQWLKKKRNLAVFILVLISISLVRHNGILYTIPLLILMLLFFRELRREAAVSLVLTLVLCPMLSGVMEHILWFFTYQFTLMPVAAVTPIFALIGILIPLWSYRVAARQTIVERLRQE